MHIYIIYALIMRLLLCVIDNCLQHPTFSAGLTTPL